MLKVFGLIFFMLSIQSCDPYGFGFKKNPVFILNEAFESILSLQPERFIDISGKEALCLYGNEYGLRFLRDKIDQASGNLEVVPKIIKNSSNYTNTPNFVGFWSYYKELYEIDIQDKESLENYFKVLVECHYGFEGEKDEAYRNLKKNKYKRKECRLIKINPHTFFGLPLNEECKPLKVNL